MTLLVLTATALAFVCPPVEEGAVLRQAGEFCGGTCDTIGRCAAGLKCEVKESPASKFSFAIVWGAKKQGVCVTDPELAMSLVETSPEQHDTPLLGSDPATYSPPKGRALVGGEKPIAVDSDEVTAAAKFGVTNIVAESNSMTPPALKQIVSATSQVVAGIKYTIVMEMTDGSKHKVVIVDTPWLTPRFAQMSHEVLV